MASISGRTFCLINFIFSTIVSLVKNQPLHLPAEPFPCGPSGTTCERWGFTTCVHPDGEFYCLPCDHEQLRTLCETKEEAHGCTLYCTQKKLETEVNKMQMEFAKEKNALQENFTAILVDIKSVYSKENTNNEDLSDLQLDISRKLQDLQIALEKSHNETKRQEDKVDSLEEDLDSSKKTIKSGCQEFGLYAIIVVLLDVAIISAVVVAIKMFPRYKGRFCRSKSNTNSEMPEMCSGILMTIRAVQDIATQTEDLNNDKEPLQEESGRDRVIQQEERHCDTCPGYAKLQNIPPSNEDGPYELAF